MLLGAACVTAAEIAPVFTGLLHNGAGYRFVLTDSVDGAASDWLGVGQDFRGCTVVAFDAKDELLTVKVASCTRQLSLKREAVKDGATNAEKVGGAHATASAPVVIVDREVEFNDGARDSNGAPFFHLKGGRTESTGPRIAIEKGKTFGLVAELAGLPAAAPVELDYLMATPPMRYPDGRMVSSAYFTEKATTSDSGTLSGQGYYFSFDNDYEMVPGRYRLEIRYKSKLLAAQEFDLYLPNAEPRTAPQIEGKTPNPAPMR